MEMYANLCYLERSRVFNTDLFEFYGVENIGVDTKNNFFKLIISKVI